MKTFSYSLISMFGFAWAMTGVAQAHIGHIGELAGHGHWIGVGALIGAAALAAALARGRKAGVKKEADEAEENAEDEPEMA